MNILARIAALERRADGLGKSDIPTALIRYADGSSKAVTGFYEGCSAALEGNVESVSGDDADFTALLQALSGTL